MRRHADPELAPVCTVHTHTQTVTHTHTHAHTHTHTDSTYTQYTHTQWLTLMKWNTRAQNASARDTEEHAHERGHVPSGDAMRETQTLYALLYVLRHRLSPYAPQSMFTVHFSVSVRVPRGDAMTHARHREHQSTPGLTRSATRA